MSDRIDGVTFETLTSFRPDAPLPPETEGEPRLSQNTEQACSTEGTLISFDQSLANTGYVVVNYSLGAGIEIVEMGVINTYSVDGNKSWTDNFQRGTQLYPLVKELLVKYFPRIVLHEMPPVGSGPFVHRSDSCVVTAQVIWVACSGVEPIPVQMVAANKMKNHLTGNPKAKKAQVAAAVKARFEGQLGQKGFRKNEHTYDALGIAATYLDGAA